MDLFNEAESDANPAAEEPTLETVVTYSRKNQSGQREAMIEILPVEPIEYRLSEEEQTCSWYGGDMHEMSTEIRQELKPIPAEVKLVKHVRFVYACRRCEIEATTTPVVTAQMPRLVYQGSLVSSSLMAYIMSQEYVESMPLYRQEQQFARLGVALSRQTLVNWMIHGADNSLRLLVERMHEHLLQKDILHSDETTLQVLREPGRSAVSQSYLWLYRTGREGPPIIIYEYQPTRVGEHPRKFLTGIKGYLHVDGYSGYYKIMNECDLIRLLDACRRKFDEALQALPDSKRSTPVTAEILKILDQLKPFTIIPLIESSILA